MSTSHSHDDGMHDAYIALGCNIGDKVQSLHTAYTKLNTLGTVKKTAYLYRSKPMYHTNQPAFLNTACLLRTSLSPEELLRELKKIEKEIGRQETFRNGPRAIDLDIILYDNERVQLENLEIPHPRMSERAFVLKPLHDLAPHLTHPISQKTIQELYKQLPLTALEEIDQVIPCRNRLTKNSRYLVLNSGLPLIMGILNVTPDSFSDGGKYDNSIDSAVNQALTMLKEGAQIIDIGGESTRPKAETIEIEIEKNRIIPVIEAIRQRDQNCIISVDTRKAAVARAAIEAGADIINDVSGGQYDPLMIPLIEETFTPYIAMHMRGEPSNMSESKYSTYHNVVNEVIEELNEICNRLDTRLPRWLQMIDPGIGFAKTGVTNQELLKPHHLLYYKERLDNRPILIGLSRKRFLTINYEETILKERKQSILNDDLSVEEGGESNQRSGGSGSNSSSVHDRDLFTAGVCCATILGKVDILRVHNVDEIRKVCDSFATIIMK